MMLNIWELYFSGVQQVNDGLFHHQWVQVGKFLTLEPSLHASFNKGVNL